MNNNVLIEALEKIATGTEPYNETEAFSFVDTAKNIANKALNEFEQPVPVNEDVEKSARLDLYLEIDTECAALEDVLHGKEGKKISYIRKLLSEWHSKQQVSNVWVSVEDDKPALATPVLIATKHWIGVGYYKKNFELNLYDEPEWSEENGEYIFGGEVTHWMPLPSPPNSPEQPINEESKIDKAIEFKDWCDANTYELEMREERSFTTKELYNIFLQSLK